MPGPVFGNRIVDLELIVEAFSQLCCPKCFAEKVRTIRGFRYGLCSHFTLKYSPLVSMERKKGIRTAADSVQSGWPLWHAAKSKTQSSRAGAANEN
ncbi:hypothetical protein TNCV_4431141 [Trichonephila clavipes]|nr:hypothetical protein TNCV_4431141 [Trichonephila clavipes]